MHGNKNRIAGLLAAETKGPEERNRAALMAAWTRKHGKNDALNPYSKENVRGATGRDVNALQPHNNAE